MPHDPYYFPTDMEVPLPLPRNSTFHDCSLGPVGAGMGGQARSGTKNPTSIFPIHPLSIFCTLWLVVMLPDAVAVPGLVHSPLCISGAPAPPWPCPYSPQLPTHHCCPPRSRALGLSLAFSLLPDPQPHPHSQPRSPHPTCLCFLAVSDETAPAGRRL